MMDSRYTALKIWHARGHVFKEAAGELSSMRTTDPHATQRCIYITYAPYLHISLIYEKIYYYYLKMCTGCLGVYVSR